MKTLIILFVTALSLLFTEKTFGQHKMLPKWVPATGYWVIEGNKNSPKENTIRFYTNENQLVYKENINGTRLNPQKKKLKKHLKAVLEKALAEWAVSNIITENKDYVKAILH